MASARACLEHLTRALAQLGVTTQSTAPPIPLHVGDDSSKDPPFLTAETLRRAKFNHPAACAPLWRALHDLSLVGCAGFPDPDVARRALASAREASARSAMQYAEAQLASGDGAMNAGDARSRRAVAAELARTAEDETCARVARRHLRRHGYPHVDELETCDARGGDSRPLLLALAWMVRPIVQPNQIQIFSHAPASRSISPSRLTQPPPRHRPHPPRRCNTTTSSPGRTPTRSPRPSSTHPPRRPISTRRCPRSPRIRRAAPPRPRWTTETWLSF